MRYHSEKIITNITLKANKKTGLRIAGITPQQVENGALITASNLERKAFFAYSAMVIAVFTAFLVPISTLFMGVYLFTLGLNLGVVLCMPFWITVFITGRLDRKVFQCNPAMELVVFSRRDLLVCVLKAGLLGTVLVGSIMWIIS